MDFREKYGPWAIVTGSSAGIGEQFARILASRGVNVLLAARRKERLERLANELRSAHGVEAEAFALDVSTPTFLEDLLTACGEKDVGLVVSNAAARTPGPYCEAPREKHVEMLEVNARAPLLLAHAFVPRLVERGRGGFLITASMESFVGYPLSATYSATKAFALSLGEALWDELREHGVDVLVLAPGQMLRASVDKPEKMPGLRPPDQVARMALDHLGRGPVVVSGWFARCMILLQKCLPRRLAVRINGKAMRATYREAAPGR
jgi:short-subunit dehydrogenase